MEPRNDATLRTQTKPGSGAFDQLAQAAPAALSSGESGDQPSPVRSRVASRAANSWARGLGLFSLGLGAAEVLAPTVVARFIGVRDSSRNRTILRAFGAHKVAAGVGLLLARRRARYLWSRVAGDVIDLAILGGAVAFDKRTRTDRASIALAAVAGMTALDTWASLTLTDEPDDDGGALARSVAGGSDQDPSVPVLAVVTISRPASEVYAFWRDFSNLAHFMTQVRSIDVRDRLESHWTVSVTGRDELQWDAVITADRPDQLIAWRSVADAAFDHVGEVRFLTAPGGRGTEVHLKMNVFPPAGRLGEAVGKLARRVPEQIIAADLKRLKQLLETGEIMKSDASIHRGRRPARPSTDDEPPLRTT